MQFIQSNYIYIQYLLSSTMSNLTTAPFQRQLTTVARTNSRNARTNLQRQSSRYIDIQLKNVQFSVTTIQFNYPVGSLQPKVLINRKLSIANKSGGRIGFKIKCNNPQNYDVYPTKKNMQDGEVCDIRIRTTLLPNTNISKYKQDQFQIQWGKVADYGGAVVSQYSQKQNIGIVMNALEQHQSKQNIQADITKTQLQCKLYQNAIRAKEQQIQELDQQIKKLKAQQAEGGISFGVGVFLGIIAFIIAYLIF